MFKAAVLTTAFTTTLALSARQAVERCPDGNQMTLTAWLGENDNCHNPNPLIPAFTLTVGKCSPVEGGTLPLFVLATYNDGAYDAKVFMADPACTGTPLTEVTGFTGSCREAVTDFGAFAVMEKKNADGSSSCKAPAADRRRQAKATCGAGEIAVEGFLGADCGSAITPDGGACVPTDGTCKMVSAASYPLPLYAKVSLVDTTGSATIYTDEACTTPVASFEDFNSADTATCVKDTTGITASVKLVGDRRRRAVTECAAGDMVVSGFLGATCSTAITADGGACVPTNGECTLVSAKNYPMALYAKVSLADTIGSATIYMDDACNAAVATFEKFSSADTNTCVKDTTDLTASIKIVNQ